MYNLTDQQIDFILNDIRARGVEMESLQLDLLDHVCCIIERELEANGDFGQFYSTTIKTFYKKELKEIEEETLTLLTNKNYYAMKKIMIGSGLISAALLSMGIVLKFLYQPGASFGIVLGVTIFSLIFMPLMFTLKIKEKTLTKDKVLLGLGVLVTMMISMAILFKLMHWPGANVMGITSVGLLILLYLPIHLITGIRNPETKTNTIVSSVLLVAGCGLFLSLARSPQGSKIQFIKDTKYFVRNELLYQNESAQIKKMTAASEMPPVLRDQSLQILTVCDEIKSTLLEKETGYKTLDENFESKNAWLGETFSNIYFEQGSDLLNKYNSLKDLIVSYNNNVLKNSKPGFQPLPFEDTLIGVNDHNERVTGTLNDLIQIELFVLKNELIFAASN